MCFDEAIDRRDAELLSLDPEFEANHLAPIMWVIWLSPSGVQVDKNGRIQEFAGSPRIVPVLPRYTRVDVKRGLCCSNLDRTSHTGEALGRTRDFRLGDKTPHFREPDPSCYMAGHK